MHRVLYLLPKSWQFQCKQFIGKLLNLIFMFLIKFLGKGVFTNKTIKASAFVVEYRGKIFLRKDRRPKKRSGDTLNGFLYEFTWNGEQWW